MKIFLLIFLVGWATASVHEALDDTAELLYHDLMVELEDENHFYYAEDDDVRTELGKKLRETLNELIEKIKERFENGKGVRQEVLDKLKELREKLKEKGFDIGDKAREALKKIRDRVQKFLDDLLENLKTKSRRHVDEDEFIEALADSRLKDMFRKLKKALLGKIDKEALKQKIHDIFGKGNEMADSLLEMLNKKGEEYKQKLLDLIDRYLGKNDEKRSIKEMWEKVKDFFKDLKIDLKEKFMKFGQWVKELGSKALGKGKSKIENIKSIAREIIDHAKGINKDVAAEALEFLRPYKEDLGVLWEQVKDSVKDILNTKSRRHVGEDDIIESLADSKLKVKLQQLKELIYEIDREDLLEKLHSILGDIVGKEMVDKILQDLLKNREDYRERLVDFIDRYLEKGQSQGLSLTDINTLYDQLRKLRELAYKISKEKLIQKFHSIFDDILGKETVDLAVQQLFKNDDYRERLVDVIDKALKRGQREIPAFANTELKDKLKELREIIERTESASM